VAEVAGVVRVCLWNFELRTLDQDRLGFIEVLQAEKRKHQALREDEPWCELGVSSEPILRAQRGL
jgi:hypothetical protein